MRDNIEPMSSKSKPGTVKRKTGVKGRTKPGNTKQVRPGPKPAAGKKPVSTRKKPQTHVKRSPGKKVTKKPEKSAKKPIRITRPGAKGTGSNDTPAELLWVEEDPKDHLLSRFIYDTKGQLVGESIGVEGKRLIMKNGLKFYSIPLKNITEKGTDLTLAGNINQKRARKLGEVWRKKALDPLYQKKK